MDGIAMKANRLVWGLALTMCLAAVAWGTLPARAQETSDAISGAYSHQNDPRAAMTLRLFPSPRFGPSVMRLQGHVTFSEPGNTADACSMAFEATLRGDTLTVADARTTGCGFTLRLGDGTATLVAAPGCTALYCTGNGTIGNGTYVRQPEHNEAAPKAPLP